MKKVILLLVTSMISGAEAYSPANNLISAFCSNVGSYTSEALSQTDQLQTIIKSLRDDENCQALASGTQQLINSVTSLEVLNRHDDHIIKLQSDLNLYQEEFALEQARLRQRYSESYLAANPGATQVEINQALLAYTPSSATLGELDFQISQVSVDLIENRIAANNWGNNGYEDKKKMRLQIIGSNAESLLDILANSTECTNTNENRAPDIMAKVLGMTSSVLTGVTGAATSLSAKLITNLSSFVRSIKYNGNLRKSELAKMEIALSCSYEGMVETYCKARDTKTILNFVTHNKEAPTQEECPDCEDIQTGLDLINNKASVYRSWLNQVLAGASPSNDLQVIPYEKVQSLRARFSIVKKTFEGMINEKKLDLADITDADVKRLELRSLMESLAKIINSNNKKEGVSNYGTRTELGPFSQFFDKDRACGGYEYIYSPNGNTESGATPQEQANCLSFIDGKYKQPVYTIDVLEERINELNLQAEEFVNREFARVSVENPNAVLRQGEQVVNAFKVSPISFMQKSLVYYDLVEEYFETSNEPKKFLIKLITRAKKQIADALTEINKQDCSPTLSGSKTNCGPEKLAKEQLTNLSLILAPDQLILSLENSLQSIYQAHINAIVNSGTIPDERLIELFNLSNLENSEMLIRNGKDFNDLNNDAENAQEVIKSNLEVFSSTFERSVYKILKNKIKSKSSTNYVGRLCVRTLLSPRESAMSKKIAKLCHGTEYKSVLPGAVKNLKYNTLSKLSFDERACILYDFNRKLRNFTQR